MAWKSFRVNNRSWRTTTDYQVALRGTGNIGYLRANFDDLCRIFGEPRCLDKLPDGEPNPTFKQGQHKSPTEWTVNCRGCTFAIYDYKEKHAEVARQPDTAYTWSLAGRDGADCREALQKIFATQPANNFWNGKRPQIYVHYSEINDQV